MALSEPNFLRGNTPRPGQSISSKSFGSLASASTAARSTVTTMQPSLQAAGGSLIFPITPRSSPRAPIIYTPFEIFTVQNIVMGTWDGTYNVTLYPGTVNQLLPTNIFSTINQTISSTQYVVLTCVSDGYVVTSSTWSLMSSQPTPPDATTDIPPSTFYITLGVIFYNSTPMTISVFQVIFTNLSPFPAEWLRITRVGAGPFELAYVIYYYWYLPP